MNNELDSLREEILLLKKRINSLEGKEKRRKAYKYTKLLIKIIIIGAIFFGIWKSYDYVVHGIPNMIEEKIKELNPFKWG